MKKPVISPILDNRFIGGWREQTTEARDAKAYLWSGTIVHVDTSGMVCSIRLNSGHGEYHDIPIPGAGSGPRSWSGNIPTTGTRVLIGWYKFGLRAYKPYIVEYLTSSVLMSRDFEPFASMDQAEAQNILSQYPEMADDLGINFSVIRLKSRAAYAGDWLASSSGGAEAILDRDVYFVNRAGNEFRLRDSDQTSVLQTINEYTCNAAGYYRRGIIRRDAFSFLPDLYPANEDGSIPTVITSDNPAYQILLSFGLINEDGTKTFPDTNPFYPNVVTADGQHAAYIVHGESDQNFSQTQYAYTEDRRDIQHISDGVQQVTEGDGFQVDSPGPVYIEDVQGTVVGNDFQSEAGRLLYKRILGMRIFDSINQTTLPSGPKLEAIDTIQDLGIIDDIALAKLLRIQSPNNSNQYSFGISKEGKVCLFIPKTKAGTSEMKGKSIEAGIAGLIKAVIGGDENSGNLSLDLRMLGGANIEIGRMNDGNSINLKLHGKIRREHTGNDAGGLTLEEVYGGSTLTSRSASHMDVTGGNYILSVGAEAATAATSISQNAGSGGSKNVCAGDLSVTVLGKTQSQYGQLMTTTWALGQTGLILAGVDNKTILAGSQSNNVLSGNMSNTVTAGNMSATVAAGSLNMNVAAGSMSATVGSGSLALTTAAGATSITSSLSNNFTAGTMNSLLSPINQIGITTIGCCVAGVPGPIAPSIDYITGQPILGISTILVG